MMRCLYFLREGKIRTDLTTLDIVLALQDEQGLLWVDFEATDPKADEPILTKTFGFHPLAVDDALRESHIPKIDDWGSYLYVVLHAVEFDPKIHGDIETLELDAFVGKNYLVTHHDKPIAALRRVWEAVQRDDRHLRGGPDHIFYRLADEVVASYMPAVEALDVAIDEAEDETFAQPTPRTLENIFRLKRAALHLRRILGPQREVMNKLARDDYAVVDRQERVYFRDVYDHLVRLFDIAESIQDLVSGALDTYLSVVNNRMNEVMKTLTVITTLFMPISFVTGFFGMNFFFPGDSPLQMLGARGMIVVTLVMLLEPIVMMWWIRRRGWM